MSLMRLVDTGFISTSYCMLVLCFFAGGFRFGCGEGGFLCCFMCRFMW